MQSPHRWPAAISIGTKPTFNEDGDAERVVEAYAITDDWLDLYGHQARVEFAGFLRRRSNSIRPTIWWSS